MLSADVALQGEVLLRLLGSALLGGLIGYERELHHHPAGVRTHLLVSLGAATFTALSIVAFELPPAPNGSIPTDPSRVAAQVVTGIGFLGAGAILKYGTTIKGLTTAASLWATASIGMAAGAGAWLLAGGGTLIVIASLWPLNALLGIRRTQGRRVRARFALDDLAAIAAITAECANRRIEVADVRIAWRASRYELVVDLRLPPGAVSEEVLHALGGIEGARLLDARRGDEDDD